MVGVALAAVIGRVVFRVIFNPGTGTGPLAIALPRVYLNIGIGPEIPVLGDITWQELQNSVLDGMRLAALLVGAILLTLLVDVRKLLAKAPKFLQPLAIAAGSALTFIPVLSENITRIRLASKIRARGKGSIVTPILEGTVERAIALAASMEVRGFASSLSSAPTARPALTDVSLSFGPNQVLNRVTLKPAIGEIILLTGATGSGKTILLQTLCGLAPNFTGGRVSGRIDTGLVGYVNQKPELSFATEKVFDEIAFALRQTKIAKKAIANRVESLASYLEIKDLLRRNVTELSAGQQQRVAIAAALATGARTLLLDEPSSALDEQSISKLRSVILKLAAEGCSVLVVEHHLERFEDLASRVLVLDRGNLGTLSIEERRELCARELNRLATTEASVHVLLGPNGSGKSTRMKNIWTENPEAAYVPQQASDLLLAQSVEAELENEESARVFAQLAPGVDTNLHPHDLSAGQQLALALAVQLSKKSNFVLLDEPTRGLDFESKNALIEILSWLSRTGRSIVLATNDQAFATAVATSTEMIGVGHND